MKYWSAINNITDEKLTNLHKYEMDEEEWRVMVQLQNMLKVCALRSIFGSQFTCSLTGARYSRMPSYVLQELDGAVLIEGAAVFQLLLYTS